MIHKHTLLRSSALFGLAITAAVTSIPSMSHAALNELVVTAQRRAQGIQSVPMAVTSFDAATIERRALKNVSTLDRVIPNIVMNNNTGQNNASKMFLRGIGDDESWFVADPPVGVYVDDVYYARQAGSMLDLFSVERIEFLRGPQGTLYGRNTTGGALKVITKKPNTDDAEAEGDVTIGSYNRIDVRGSANIPVSDNTALQIAALSRNMDGYTRNLTTGKKVNAQDVTGLRASLLHEFNDDLDILITADVIKDRSDPGYATWLANDGLSPSAPFYGDYFVTSESPGFNPRNEIDMYGVSATLTYDGWDIGTVKSVTTYRSFDQQLQLDGIGFEYLLDQDHEQWQASQEFQLTGTAMDDRLNYSAGLYYFHEDNEGVATQAFGLLAQTLATNPQAHESLETDSFAIYASGTYDVTDALAITLGGRYTYEEKKWQNNVLLPGGVQDVWCVNPTQTALAAADDFQGTCTPADLLAGMIDFENASADNPDWSDFTPRLVVDYKFNDDFMVYGSVAKGWKSGSFAGRVTHRRVNLFQASVDPEDSLSYEAGFKSEFADNRVRLNANAFLVEYSDLQIGVTDPSIGGFTRLTGGDSKVKGLEVEFQAAVTDNFEIFGNVGLQDAEWEEFKGPLSTCAGFTSAEDYKSLDIKQTPEWSYRIGADYTVQTANNGSWSFGGDWTEKDTFYNNVCNTPEIGSYDYKSLNAQVAYESADERWRLTLSGTNLTDEDVFAGGFSFGEFAPARPAYMYPPRMISLNFRYRM